LRFEPIWIGSDGIALAIHHDRFQIEYQVVVASEPDD
jgi:hypothetical protein